MNEISARLLSILASSKESLKHAQNCRAQAIAALATHVRDRIKANGLDHKTVLARLGWHPSQLKNLLCLGCAPSDIHRLMETIEIPYTSVEAATARRRGRPKGYKMKAKAKPGLDGGAGRA